MEIATPVDLDAIPYGVLQFLDELEHHLRLIAITRIRVGRGHDVGSASVTRHAGHVQAYFERWRSVVEAGQNVGMNVNHSRKSISPIGETSIIEYGETCPATYAVRIRP